MVETIKEALSHPVELIVIMVLLTSVLFTMISHWRVMNKLNQPKEEEKSETETVTVTVALTDEQLEVIHAKLDRLITGQEKLGEGILKIWRKR